MHTTKEIFCYNFKQIRKIKKITQEDLALKCDVSKTTVTNWETGKLFPSANNIDLICKALECKPIHLLLEEGFYEKKKDNGQMQIEQQIIKGLENNINYIEKSLIITKEIINIIKNECKM